MLQTMVGSSSRCCCVVCPPVVHAMTGESSSRSFSLRGSKGGGSAGQSSEHPILTGVQKDTEWCACTAAVDRAGLKDVRPDAFRARLDMGAKERRVGTLYMGVSPVGTAGAMLKEGGHRDPRQRCLVCAVAR